MFEIHLQGSMVSTAPTKQCADHGRTAVSEGGAEIRAGVWVCAQCLRRRTNIFAGRAKTSHTKTSQTAKEKTASAAHVLGLTRAAWGIEARQ